MTSPFLEIAAQTASDVQTAIGAGANQVELCEALDLGGMSPSLGLVEAAIEAAGEPGKVNVLLRPRAGGFHYTPGEIAIVSRDIEILRELSVGSVVIGALDDSNQVDFKAVETWVEVANGLPVVFHRAIDVLTHPEQAVPSLAAAGVTRILSSGGAPRALEGISTLGRMVERSQGRIQILAGGGVQVPDIPALLSVGVSGVHLSARHKVGMNQPSGPGGGESGYWETDASIVKDAVAKLA
ncbi:MAG: hypothetical protein LBR21_00390 [Propionibacteriaceae bacterium]|nr:hypothetical protein [Propionibacteriaceae bacterium]